MEKLFAILGMFVFIGLGYLLSKDKKSIQWKSVGLAFVAQLVLAFILIKTPVWKGVEYVARGVEWIINQSTEGISFVFGGISDNWVFFLNALLPIVFISALMGILFHFNIIQKFVAVIGKCIARFLKVDPLVAVNATTNMFLGQNESLFVTKSYLPKASDSVIFACMVGGMTSISVSVVGLYTSFGASMEWIIVSMPLTVFSTFVLTQMVMPTKYDGVDKLEIEDDKGVNCIDTMMSYATVGFKSVIGIAVALMVFISVVFMINNLLGFIFPALTLQKILGVFFYPLALLMGVPMNELGMVSEILATKLALNEAVAYSLPQFNMLAENTKAMITVALAGFAGIGSIGILMGGMAGIAPNKVQTVAKLGVKAVLVATIVNLLSGAVIAVVL